MSNPKFLRVQSLEAKWDTDTKKAVYKERDIILVNTDYIKFVYPIDVTMENGDVFLGSTLDMGGQGIHTNISVDTLHMLMGV